MLLYVKLDLLIETLANLKRGLPCAICSLVTYPHMRVACRNHGSTESREEKSRQFSLTRRMHYCFYVLHFLFNFPQQIFCYFCYLINYIFIICLFHTYLLILLGLKVRPHLHYTGPLFIHFRSAPAHMNLSCTQGCHRTWNAWKICKNAHFLRKSATAWKSLGKMLERHMSRGKVKELFLG